MAKTRNPQDATKLDITRLTKRLDELEARVKKLEQRKG